MKNKTTKETAKLSYIYVQPRKGGVFEKLGINQFAELAERRLKLKPAQTKAMIAMIVKGEELEPDPVDDEKRQAFYASAFSELEKVYNSHVEHSQKIEDEKAIAEQEAQIAKEAKAQEDAKFANELTLLGAKGNALAALSVTGYIQGSNAVLKKFDVCSTGLKPKDGATIGLTDALGAVAYMASNSEQVDRIKNSSLWGLGDAVVLTEENFEDGKGLVEQLAKVTGKQKHTIREARRLCRSFKGKDRHEELTYTHHQEILNYQGKIDKRTMNSIIKRCLKGDETTLIEGPDGKTIEQNTPWPCRRLRQELRDAAGIKDAPDPVEDDGGDGEAAELPARPTLFIYVDTEGNVFQSEDYDEDAARVSACVIDIDAMTVMDPRDGSEIGGVLTLDPDKAWPATAEPDEIPA